MRKTKNEFYINPGDKILVNTRELANLLSLGEGNAMKLGENANAVVRLGKRKLYNVKKIQAYVDGI